MLKLRPYQQDLYDRARSEFAAGKRSVLCVCATGGGKSYIFMAMCKEAAKKGRVLVLAHRTELLDQHAENFRKNGISLKNITIASVQSVYRKLHEYKGYHMVCADEAHLFKARTFERVLNHFRENERCFTVGFTATPLRLDGSSLKSIFDSMVVGPGTKELIEKKCLSPYIYLCPSIVDVANLKKRAGDYAVEDIEAVMDGKIYGDAVREYVERCKGKQGIAFCCSIAHSKSLAQKFRKAGISAEHIDGDLSKQQRKEIMSRFRNGDIKVLCNVNLISEGLSVDGVHVVMLLRPTLSVSLFLQQIGRGLRFEKGKTCIVLDFVSNVYKHGLPDMVRTWSLDVPPKSHKEWTEDGQLTLRVCDYCFKTYEYPASHCPFCKHIYVPKQREIITCETIRLKRIEEEKFLAEQKRKEEAAKEIRNARSFDELLRIEKKYSYRPGWAAIRARLRGYR